MKFSSEGKTLSLLIHNYQFPELAGKNNLFGFDHDANWLNIMLTLQEGPSTFVQIDPFLMTTEVEELMYWLQSLPNPSATSIEFIEPSLELYFLGEHSSHFHIRVSLCLELLPPWSIDENIYETDFFLTADEIRECVHSLHKQLTDYPIRR